RLANLYFIVKIAQGTVGERRGTGIGEGWKARRGNRPCRPATCSGGGFGAAIERGVGDNCGRILLENPMRVTRKPILVAAAMASLSLLGESSQDAKPPREFDAVSVKPLVQTGPGFSITWKLDPTMLRVTAEPLKTYVMQAFSLKPYQVISNGPQWIETDR